jgi:hypothetical protein
MDAPSAHRNKEPILSTLTQNDFFGAGNGLNVLEIAAGSGIHTQFFCKELSGERVKSWSPTDPDTKSLASINAYMGTLVNPNYRVEEAVALTLGETPSGALENAWGDDDRTFDFMLCVNMIHIAPWSATIGLFTLASQKLASDKGVLVLYGPFGRGYTVPSNEAFDASLKQKDQSWGVRELAAVEKVANEKGMEMVEVIEMPANNNVVVFKKKRET